MGKINFKEFAELLKRAQEGSDDAFHEIYRRTYRAQICHLQTILTEPEEIQDALQEVYLLLYQHLDKINPPKVLIAYLNRLTYYVGKNAAKISFRRVSRMTVLEDSEELSEPESSSPLHTAIKKEQIQLLHKAIDSLPPKERSVIFMRYYQSLKHSEVALSLGISQASAKRLQASAQKHLKELLAKEGISSYRSFVPLGGLGLTSQLADDAKATTGAPGALISGNSTALFTSLAALGLTVAITAGSLTSPLSIEEVRLPDKFTKAPAAMEVRVKSTNPIRRIEAKSADGTTAYGVRTEEDLYTIPIPDNGDYTITVSTNAGKTSTTTAQVDCIDATLPQAHSCRVEGNRLHVVFEPDESGVDFDTLRCLDENGTGTAPEHIDTVKNEVVFLLPNTEARLYIRDRAGNVGVMPIHYNGE